MELTISLGQLITIVIFLAGAFAGLGKLLLMQHGRQMERALQEIKDDAKLARQLEIRFLQHLADLPVHYLRREDYVRGQTVIEAKLDAIAGELKMVQIKVQGGKN